MRSSQGNYSIEGVLRFDGTAGEVELVATTPEGTRERIDVPIARSEIRGDSLFLAFAPIGFELRGRCLSPVRFEGSFSVPQPPFEPIRGVWDLRRSTGPGLPGHTVSKEPVYKDRVSSCISRRSAADVPSPTPDQGAAGGA